MATIASTTHADPRPTVIALHCSGGNGAQWDALAAALGNGFNVIAPDLIGCESTGHWTGDSPFSLSEEAAPIMRLIDAAPTPVHLVGHSYGGCVAMRAAYERPGRIASLSLYEPVAFYALGAAGTEGKLAYKEIYGRYCDIQLALKCGAPEAAAEIFVNYWNGAGAWNTLHPKVRAAVVRYIPKAPLEFEATFGEHVPLTAYRFNFPVLLMRGEHTPVTTWIVAEQLACAMRAPVERIDGAGHMGPLTHAETVMAKIVRTLRQAELGASRGVAA